MRTKTNPQTMKTRVVVTMADMTALCRVLDILDAAGRCNGENQELAAETAVGLRAFADGHQPEKKPAKDTPGQKNMLEPKE